MELVNLTPFAAERAVLLDATGRETLLVVVKATFDLASGKPVIAERPDPVTLADEYVDEPDASSLRRASDMVLAKPVTDVLVSGSAYPAQDKGSEALVVLRLAELTKGIHVFGDREWVGDWGASPSRPAPFRKMPLVHERAFGGKDVSGQPHEWCAENPVGVGFRGKSSKLPVNGTRLPNLEDPHELLKSPKDRPRSFGVGPIAPWWSPRPELAGTYDARWQKERMPLPPEDFDPAYHQAAPPDQRLPRPLAGGEPLTLTGVRPGGGGYHVTVPVVRPEVVVRVNAERHTPPVRCDTLLIDAEAERLSLVFRASLVIHGRVTQLLWIKVQEQNA